MVSVDEMCNLVQGYAMRKRQGPEVSTIPTSKREVGVTPSALELYAGAFAVSQSFWLPNSAPCVDELVVPQ